MEDRLQKFARLVDSGNFTRAARELHISQPALSAAVRKLERELHAELLVRSSHHLTTTAAGQVAYDAGKDLTVRAHNLRQRLAELDSARVPISIGMIDSIATLLFAHGQELDALEAWAHVALSVNNSGLLVQGVLQHQLDVAIVVEQLTVPKMLTMQRLGAEPLIMIGRPDVAARARKALAEGHLPDFLSYDKASNTHRLVQAAAARRGIVLEPSLYYSTSPEMILQLVLAGRGVAALPYHMLKSFIAAGELEPIFLQNDCVIERPIVAVQQVNRHLPERLQETLARTKQELGYLLAESRKLTASTTRMNAR